MSTVRLILYRHNGERLTMHNVEGPTVLDAAVTAALRGMDSGRDFHVIEPEGAPLALYWNGRKGQTLGPADVRTILERICAQRSVINDAPTF